jgi:hypothetical protein
MQSSPEEHVLVIVSDVSILAGSDNVSTKQHDSLIKVLTLPSHAIERLH